MGLGDHSGVMVRLHSSGIDRSRRRDAEDDHGEPCWKGSEKHAGRMPVWRVSLRLCIARSSQRFAPFRTGFRPKASGRNQGACPCARELVQRGGGPPLHFEFDLLLGTETI